MSFFGNLSSLFNTNEETKQSKSKSGAKTSTTKSTTKGKQANASADVKKNSAAKQPTHRSNRNRRSSRHNKTQQSQSQKPQQLSKQQVDNVKVMQDTMLREAKAKSREIIVEAKGEALAIRSAAEKKSREDEKKLNEQQSFLQAKLDKLDNRLSQIDSKEARLEDNKKSLDKLKKDIEVNRNKVLERLEKISEMTKGEAQDMLFDGLEKKLRSQMAKMVRQFEEEAREEADKKSKEILIDAMKYGATDDVAEYTVSIVKLPAEDVKGKIIGKSGRNIHAFERVTGVDVDLDASPTEVKLSCFDPVRREIARVALEKLIKDGRIQPARIEEVVAKTKKETEKIMLDAGKKLCHTLGVYNLPHGLVQMLGRFKYRFSYGQNMITHTIEETKIGMKIAHEIGIDVNVVKLGCLLHDIGKVAEDADDSHVILGVKIAKKYGMPQPVIDCIAQHHEDEPFSGPEQMAVYIADAISGARPGARYENHDDYIKRLEGLEAIATAYKEVKSAYAIQAGRELRVLLIPDISKDDDVTVLAVKIKDEIQEKMTYPGTVKVTVIRELRGQGIAK